MRIMHHLQIPLLFWGGTWVALDTEKHQWIRNDGNKVKLTQLPRTVKTYDISHLETLADIRNFCSQHTTFTSSAAIKDGPRGHIWYNILWIPHRIGLLISDNFQYGRLLLFPMTGYNNEIWTSYVSSGNWSGFTQV